MKKLDKLILKSFFGPLLLTFSITMFILVLFFLWQKVETIIGKGLDTFVILKLFAYASATFVPLALPISILLASIMTMGSFSERFELSAIKSAGISLWRVFRWLIISCFVLTLLAFVFASFIIPKADQGLKIIASDVRDKKPTINIRPQEFYYDINSYAIRIDKKDKNTDMMHGILIYNHSNDNGNTEVISAKKGYMYSDEDNKTLVFELYDGNIFSEDVSPDNFFSRPLNRIEFSKQVMRFDVSDFAFQKSDDDKYSDSYKALNIVRLRYNTDSLEKVALTNQEILDNSMFNVLSLTYDKALAKKSTAKFDFYKDFKSIENGKQKEINLFASDVIKDIKGSLANFDIMKKIDSLYLTRHKIEFHRKFSLSVACLIFLFIGAPLGAIIKKGGLGLPVVVSLISFILYYIIGTMGESSAKSGSLTPFAAMWLSSAIYIPIGIILTLKATFDSKLFDLDNLNIAIRRVFSFNKKERNKKEESDKK